MARRVFVQFAVLVVLIGMLSACGGSSSSLVPVVPNISPDELLAMFGPTTIAQGVTSEGYHFLGSSDAPVTLTDYSDFL